MIQLQMSLEAYVRNLIAPAIEKYRESVTPIVRGPTMQPTKYMAPKPGTPEFSRVVRHIAAARGGVSYAEAKALVLSGKLHREEIKIARLAEKLVRLERDAAPTTTLECAVAGSPLAKSRALEARKICEKARSEGRSVDYRSVLANLKGN
jgi:hypothetical protein